MKIEIAKNAGFCFGVKRAVDLAFENANQDKKIYTVGDIIHNKFINKKLLENGVINEEDLSKIPDGSTVLVRAHGAPENLFVNLEKKACKVIDATCPFVSKIHKIVKEQSQKGDVIFIIGSKEHPEVLGIRGWCDESYVFSDEQEMQKFTKFDSGFSAKCISVVAQTTINEKKFQKIKEIIKKEYTNAKIFDTICRATHIRQEEVRSLALGNDAVIIIGDPKSSNTKRLFEISKEILENTFLVECKDDLKDIHIDAKRIGISAGASTPEFIIKEVTNTMESRELSFEELLEGSFKTLNTGDRVTGIVTRVAANEVQVDLGVKQSGYIHASELSDDPTYDVETNVKVGDEIEAIVTRVNDVDGMISLSKKRIDMQKGFEEVENAKEEGTILEGFVTEENKGGVIVLVNGVRVFVPASQTGVLKGEELSTILKTKVRLKVLEVNRQRRRVLGSIRAVLAEERKALADKVWEGIEKGQKFTGTVKSLTNYGAFVDIGGVDGMVHVSELSWSRIKSPAEVVKVGDSIDVYILSVDKEARKISLGYKDPQANPWKVFENAYALDDTAKVKIIKFMPFGAFAEVVPGVDGLIHISQISDKRIAKAEEVLSVGQEVEAKIIEIDAEKQKVSLSIRALLDDYIPADDSADEE